MHVAQMKVKKKECSKCLELQVIWKNSGGQRFCKRCWSTHSNNSKPIPYPKQKPLAPRSSKRVKQDAEYSRERKLFLELHPMCQAHIPGLCAHVATDVHHMRGRSGNLYLDKENWLALCRACHQWCELNPVKAKELGLSKSRLEK